MSRAQQQLPVGLRQRKKDRLREGLFNAALTLFQERGFEATTVDDIVAAVEVSRRTFFRYFDSKEAVVLAWVDAMVAELVAELVARPAGEASFVAMHRATVTVLARYEADRPRYLALERLVHENPTIRAAKREKMLVLCAALAQVLGERLDQPPDRALMPRLVAHLGSAVIEASIETWMARKGKGSLVALLDEGFAAVKLR